MTEKDIGYWVERYEELLLDYLPSTLIRRCLQSIQHNDLAHHFDHIYMVCSTALMISQSRFNKHEVRMILAGALMHDLGCRYDRATHHILSSGMSAVFLEYESPDLFTKEQVVLIAKMCLEHRASFKGERSSEYSEIVALADRGVPDINLYIKRALLFRLNKGDDQTVIVEEVYKHLLDKFAPITGYQWEAYPALGKEIFHNEWESFFDTLLDSEKCIKLIESQYDSLN